MPTDQKELIPYVGPRPFERTEADRARFFGRDRETQEIVSLIVSQPLVLVYAQSGAGKTSLFNARVAPTLEEKGFEVLPLTRVRGAIPEGVEPQDIANLYVFSALLNLEPKADPRALADKSLAAFLEERPRTTKAEGKPAPRAIIFDQFEEIFTLYSERWYEQQETFFHQVAEALAADPLLRVVFVIREEYLARLDSFARLLPERLRTRFHLECLREGAALAAVTGPLKDTGRSFAEGVAEKLVKDLLKIRIETGTGEVAEVLGEFVEPVQLQVVCQSLWRDLPPDVTVITQDHLQAFGNVNQTLSRFYEGAIKTGAQRAGVKERELRTWSERNLITPAGTRGTVYRGREETGGIPNAAVDVLENLHLIRGERRAGARWYELTHDRFIGPIQRSNEAWHAARRQRWLRRAGVVGAAVITIIALVLPLLFQMQVFKHSGEAWKSGRATGEVIAEVIAEATATHVARLSQATATVAAAELSEVSATATVEAMVNDYIRQGFDYADKGDYERAIAAYTEAIKLDPDYAPAYLSRGWTYYGQSDYKQAIADYNQAIELDPNYAYAYNDRGIAYYHQGDYERAIADYNKAIELNHDPLSWPYNNRGLAYAGLGDNKQAITDYTKAIELDPGYVKAYNNRGEAYADLGDYEQAIADFTKVIELDSNYAPAYNSRGLAFNELKEYASAISDFTKAVELDPGYAFAYNNRGWAYSQIGDYERAFQDFEKSVGLNPNNPWVYYNRGLTYANLGDKEKAIADLERALQLTEPPLNENRLNTAKATLERLRGQ